MSDPLSIPGVSLESVELVRRLGDHTYYRAIVLPERRTVTITVVTAIPSSDAFARMVRERELLPQLGSHPNIARVTAVGELPDLSTYIVTEVLAGGPLALDIAEGPFDWRDAADLGIRMAGALATSHHAGILHRALSPLTIMSRHTGEPMLSEFGIPTGGPGPWSSPDVCRGLPCRLADDVFSLAATVLTLITGHPPPESPLGLATALATLSDRDVPEVMVHALETTLRGAAEARPTAEELGRAFQEALQISGEPVNPLIVDTELIRRAAPLGDPPASPYRTVIDGADADDLDDPSRPADPAGRSWPKVGPATRSRQRGRRWFSRSH